MTTIIIVAPVSAAQSSSTTSTASQASSSAATSSSTATSQASQQSSSAASTTNTANTSTNNNAAANNNADLATGSVTGLALKLAGANIHTYGVVLAFLGWTVLDWYRMFTNTLRASHCHTAPLHKKATLRRTQLLMPNQETSYSGVLVVQRITMPSILVTTNMWPHHKAVKT